MSKVYPHRRKADANQTAIVAALHKAGYGVLDIHAIGRGAPDLIVSDEHDSVLVEVKELGEGYTEDELKFAQTWPGKIITAITQYDVLAWFQMRRKERAEHAVMPDTEEMLRRYHATTDKRLSEMSGKSQEKDTL